MATKTNTEINGQRYYKITRTVGHKMVEGKKVPVKKQFYGSSKGDAEKKYKEYVNEQAKIKYEGELAFDIATLNMRASEYIDNVLEVTVKYSKGTKDRYKRTYITHIKGTWLDQMIVKDIKAATIQKFYNELDVSAQTLRMIQRFMAALYKWMMNNEYADNVLAAVELPQKPDNKRKDTIIVWEDEELNAILAGSAGHRLRFMFYLLNYTGMRISEVLGLKYGDIRDDTVHVTKQLYEGELVPPKYNSKRDIPMHTKLIHEFKLHKLWHEVEMKQNNYSTDYVFTTAIGTPYDVSNLRKTFARYYKSIGVPNKSFHVYRATFCTNLCLAGAELQVASKLLGHKSLEVTAAHYALVKQESKKDAIELLK